MCEFSRAVVIEADSNGELLGHDELQELAAANRDAYSTADPFPHAVIDGLLPDNVLDEVLVEFPNLAATRGAKRYRDANQRKLASKGDRHFGPKTQALLEYLNSPAFLSFLSRLTGIENLIADRTYEGGGLHEIKRGGLLKIHADFNKHRATGWDRRLNVLVYLNKDWSEEFGGHLELWDQSMSVCKQRVLPLFNRLTVFTTSGTSYHGHPEPLTCPADRSRRSLALYYYTEPVKQASDDPRRHTTLFQQRPGSSDAPVRLATRLKRFFTRESSP